MAGEVIISRHYRQAAKTIIGHCIDTLQKTAKNNCLKNGIKLYIG